MKGRQTALVITIISLMLLAGYLYTRETGHSTEIDTSSAQILAYLGGLNCYSYEENITTVDGNKTFESNIRGGKINGAYYFEGQRDGLSWYAVVINDTLVERILMNGTARDVNVTISKDEKAMFLSADPVRIALQAVGAGKILKRSGNRITYGFDIMVSPSRNVEMNGTVTVFWDGRRVTKLTFDVDVKLKGREPEKRTVTAVLSEDCKKPEWMGNILG